MAETIKNYKLNYTDRRVKCGDGRLLRSEVLENIFPYCLLISLAQHFRLLPVEDRSSSSPKLAQFLIVLAQRSFFF